MPAQELQLIDALHSDLVSTLERGGTNSHNLTREFLALKIDSIFEIKYDQLAPEERSAVKEKLINRMLGLGALEPVLSDPTVTEIMVNGPKAVFVEREGKLIKENIEFGSDAEVLQIINRIVSRVGRRIDESSPLVDARLPDGSRVNAIIPPLSRVGPALTIRRFPAEGFTLQKLVARGTLSAEMGLFLRACVAAKQNILISGSTGSGKTSTLNALAEAIPKGERLVTIEDTAEMRLEHPHLVALEARPPNIEGAGEITIRTLLKNALRMRPDRIIVGEVRGGEAMDMLQAMNTGHQGSLTTVHANSAEEALLRLETMAMMADINLPLSAIRLQVQSAIHYIIQEERLPSGERKIVAIGELTPGRGSGAYSVRPIFKYDKIRREFVNGRSLPERVKIFEEAGVALNLEWFAPSI